MAHKLNRRTSEGMFQRSRGQPATAASGPVERHVDPYCRLQSPAARVRRSRARLVSPINGPQASATEIQLTALPLAIREAAVSTSSQDQVSLFIDRLMRRWAFSREEQDAILCLPGQSIAYDRRRDLVEPDDATGSSFLVAPGMVGRLRRGANLHPREPLLEGAQ